MTHPTPHLSEEDLVLLYYNEPEAPCAGRAHLAECAACRLSAESLARTLDVCSEWTAPDVDPGFGREMWLRLEPHLRARSPVSPVWIAVAAVAALVIAAFFLGRISRRPDPDLTAGLSPAARQRILAITLADHLDRAEILLTEISHMDAAHMSPADAPALARERNRAKDLVNEDRLLHQTLLNQGDASMLPFLDQVGRFVLEVANAPERTDPGEIDALKRRIDSESLLFKVRIVATNLRPKRFL